MPAQLRAGRSLRAILIAILLYAAVYALTICERTGDTPIYVDDILTYFQNGANASPAQLWEFGHLLWRPAGYALWRLAHPILASWYNGNPTLQVTAVLFGLNILAGIALVPLAFFTCRRLGLDFVSAWAVTTGLLLSATVLNYLHSGSSYNVGLALSLLGQLLMLDSADRSRPGLRAALAGVAFAFSVAIWFPYILGLPASFLIGWFRHARIRLLLITIASTAITGAILFGTGAAICGIASPAAFMHWISSSAHGVDQHRQLVRLPSGITRSFLNLGDDGLLMKRFVFGDPYAPVRWFDLLQAGIWKVALVFAMFTCMIWTLARNKAGWKGLLVLIVGFTPTLLFALFLFEPSEPARFETLYVAMIAAICAVIPLTAKSRVTRWLLIAFLVSIVVVNLRAYGWDLRKIAYASSERSAVVRANTGNHGIAFLLSFRDPLSTYFQRNPFDPGNSSHALPFYHVIEPASVHAAVWRNEAGCRALQAWKEGGEVWLSKRLFAERPKPEWNWVEHDDERVHWTDLPTFFQPLDTDQSTGGEDGFARLVRNAKNQTRLETFCPPTSETKQ